MGYRSEVLIRLEFSEERIYKEFKVEHLLNKFEWVEPIQELEKEWDDYKWSKDGILLRAEDWKWYESHDIVKACDAMWEYFKDLQEDRTDIDGCYLRVGEESGDIDESFINNGYELGYCYSGINYEG